MHATTKSFHLRAFPPYATALVLLAAQLGCASGDPVDPGGPVEERDLDAYIHGLGHLVVADIVPKTEIACDDTACPDASQEGNLACTYKRFTQTEQFDRLVALQPNSATLWPGSIVRGEDAQEGLLTPVGAPLAPVTFSISLENIDGSPVGVMADPSLSAFRAARNDILTNQLTGAAPASIDFDISEVYSESQLSIALGASVGWPGGADVAASFDFGASEKKTRVLVNFTQAYYTIDVDTPSQPEDFFQKGVTVEDLEPFMNHESPPLYVQSITFGRRVLFSVESSESGEHIAAALEAAYAGAVEASVGVSIEQKQMLKDATIHAFVLGGAGSDATGVIDGFDGLVQYIKSGAEYSKDSPGAPIAYKLAYLDNAVTKMAFTTEYTERTCVENQATLRAELVSFAPNVGGDGIDGDIELYGFVSIRYPTPDSPVTSCSEGGKVTPIWDMVGGSSWVSIPEQSTWTPTSPITLVLENIPSGPGSKICLLTHLWEADELTSSDDLGGDELLVSFDQGWNGEQVLHPHGAQSAAVDVTVKLMTE